MKADLHIHTTASDGTATPTEIIERAKFKGLDLVAVTDHDTVGGVAEAITVGEKCGVKVIAGIELSTFSNCEIHILGYGIAYKNPEFVESLLAVKKYRANRNAAIGKKLDALGIKLDLDYQSDGLGRMNIARAMTDAGFAKDVNEAFEKYLGVNGKAKVEARRMTPIEAVKLIKQFGGVATVAHPKKYLLDKRLEILVDGLKKFGLEGIETYYPSHGDEDIAAIKKIAVKYNLFQTGGSDFHGEGDKDFVFIPDAKLLKRFNL